MANVLFKRGHHANLPATGTSAVIDGAFYLTDDTHRLYVGQGTELVELNKSITTVANISALPAVSTVEEGQFYYVMGSGSTAADNTHNGNILAVCVKDGANKKWVQVNPDTDDGYDVIKSFAFGNAVVNSTANTITYTATVERAHVDANGQETSLADLTGSFVINGSDLASITTDVEVDLSSTAAANDSVTVNTSGSGSKTNGTGITLTGGDNVSLTGGNGSAITIAATDTTYDLSSPAGSATVVLSGSANGSSTGDDSVTFAAGTALSVDGSTAGSISYSHANVAASASGDDSTKHTTATAATASNNATINVVDSIVVNAQGHVTNVATKTITAKDTYPTGGSITVSGEGISGSISLNDSSSVTLDGGSDVLYHNLTIDGTSTKVSNQGTLATNLYSAAAVDSLIAGLNAMTYKGTVGTGGDVAVLPTSGVKVGDTYMVASDAAGSNSNSKVGDLYIASGTETNGVITSGLTWTLVPAGNDTDTHYTYSVDSTGLIEAVPSTGAGNVIVAQVVGGTDITGSVSNSVITLNHDTIAGLPSTAQGSNSNLTPAAGESFKVPVITVNNRGHVSVLSENTITLPDDSDTLYDISVDKTGSQVSIKLSETNGSSSTTAEIVGDGVVTVDKNASDQLALGHANVLTNNSGTAGSYGPSANATIASTFTVPQVTVDAKGHVTGIVNRTLTLPDDDDTQYEMLDTSISVATASGATTATVTYGISEVGGGDDTATLKLKSESLTLSQPTGTTDTIQAEIVWGSF